MQEQTQHAEEIQKKDKRKWKKKKQEEEEADLLLEAR